MKEGRLEFINGGIVSSDEACPTYEDLIANVMAGHAFLQREFQTVPRMVWHPDSFGHSAATPELYSKMGFEAIFFSRLDDDEKTYRKQHQTLEFQWQPTYESVNGQSPSSKSIFTHIMHE